jgi:predicted small secreted protein
MKKSFVLYGAFILLGIMGCNTVKGMGEDIGTVGRWLTRGSKGAENAATSPATTTP